MKMIKTMRLNPGLVFLAAMLLANCSGQKESKTENSIPVKVQEVKPSNISGKKDYVGIVEASTVSSLSFQVMGNVEQVLVSEGQTVTKGQLLAVLDKSSLKSAHAAALASLKQAQDAYKRLTVLHDNKSLPEIKYVEMQTNLDKAKSAEEIARKNLRECKLVAPFAGVIGERSIEPGMNAMPAQGVFKLLKMDQLKIKVSVPENEIASTKVGQKVRIRVAALGDICLEGQIDQKGVVANSLSHTYDVKIALSKPNVDLRPGMVCKVIIEPKDSKAQIVVPTQVVQLSQKGENYVWVAQGNQAVKRTISVGDLTDYGVMVTSGLQSGDKVIVEGYQKVSVGSKIKLL